MQQAIPTANSTSAVNATPALAAVPDSHTVPAGAAQPVTSTDRDITALRDQARQAYRKSVDSGDPLSGRELGGMFDRSGRWGRDRIAEVRAEDARQPDPADEAATPVAATRQPRGGRTIAWVAFTSGILASIAANVMHAQTVTASTAAWVGAAFWPLALMLAVEVLTRVRWPHGSRWYDLARYGGTTMVATVAAVISYRHMTGLLAAWGEDPINAHLGPLAVDGLMVIAAAALLATTRTSRN